MENIIFTDGSSRGNPGPGGWGCVVVKMFDTGLRTEDSSIVASVSTASDSIVTELGGGDKHTTNNRMELMAVIGGLSHVSKDSKNIVYTDSKYLINGITKWMHGWKKNGWITKAEEDVLNKDLWMKLDELMKGRKVSFKYVGGHIGIVGNERCDHIATAFADGRKIKLYKGSLASYDLPNILNVSHDSDKKVAKKSTSSHSKTAAYSYVSSVGGVIEVHHSWAECEKRVKGAKGARYKKATSVADEAKILEEFEAYLV